MSLAFLKQQQKLTITLEGDLRRYDDLAQQDKLLGALREVREINFAAQKLVHWDSALAAFLYQVALKAKQKDILFDIQGLPRSLSQLLELALAVDRKPVLTQPQHYGWVEYLGEKGIQTYYSLKKVGQFLTEVVLSVWRLVTGKAVMRRVDFEFALEDCGYKAVGIVSLVSFMVGLILAFVGALQLKVFGAQIYIASLVTIGMTRIMGAIMAGIIMAGRTGAAYAATIGTMQVNEEVDALKTFGFSVSDFLVLPRLLSLIITMPLLTMLADLAGMAGGAFVAVVMMDISAPQYWLYSTEAFSLTNFVVGLFHGWVYGIIIACCGCYYGITCGRNADSVGRATTQAVVSSIVIMIVVTGLLTLMFEVLGI